VLTRSFVSLPLWMAYWAYGLCLYLSISRSLNRTSTAGFELSSVSYFQRIRVALYQLWQASQTVKPLNRRAVSSFIQSDAIRGTEHILSGFTRIGRSSPIDTRDPQFDVFRKYTGDLETKMEAFLSDYFGYQLDGEALALIVNHIVNPVTMGGRPEKVC
jgi:hypothetical protein